MKARPPFDACLKDKLRYYSDRLAKAAKRGSDAYMRELRWQNSSARF